jgi:hypothetical protein
MEHIWTVKNTYLLNFSNLNKRFRLDFIPYEREPNNRCCVLNHTLFEKTWKVYRFGCLILLRDGSYLFVGSVIHHFSLYPGDMIIRIIGGADPETFCIMTRFSTIMINKSTITTIVDSNTNLPPEIHYGFNLDHHFYADKINLPMDYDIVHKGTLLRKIFHG